MKSNRIGIVTLYHNSMNYGGLLQAFALVQAIKNMGFDAEQIDFDNYRNSIKETVLKRIRKEGPQKENTLYYAAIAERKEVLRRFRNDIIPHSNETYDYRSINKTNSIYDTFICGSDQIWNYYKNDVYYLRFVDFKKKKFSYAAGMSNRVPKDSILRWTIDSVNRMDGISVREKETVDILKEARKEIKVVIDPTLLITREQWEKYQKNRKGCGENYILCYFLSNDISIRKTAIHISEKYKLKIISVPYLNIECYDADNCFGDYQAIGIDPFELIGLIRNASLVLTDSFHVTLFSNLFGVNHITFERLGHPEMNSRVDNLLSLFGNENKYCLANDDLNTIFRSVDDYVHRHNSDELSKMRAESMDFLSNMLG